MFADKENSFNFTKARVTIEAGFSGHFFISPKLKYFVDVTHCDLMHDVETIHGVL